MAYPSNTTAVGADPSTGYPVDTSLATPSQLPAQDPNQPKKFAARLGGVTFDDDGAAKPYAYAGPPVAPPPAAASTPAPLPPVAVPAQPILAPAVATPPTAGAAVPIQTSASGPVVQPATPIAPQPIPSAPVPGTDALAATPAQQPAPLSAVRVAIATPPPTPVPSPAWQPPVPLTGDALEVMGPMIQQQDRQRQLATEQQHWTAETGWQNRRADTQDAREEDYRRHMLDQEQQKIDMEKRQTMNAAATEDQAETGRRYVVGPDGVKTPISDPATGKPLFTEAKLGTETDETTGRPVVKTRDKYGNISGQTDYKAWDAEDSDTAQAAAKEDLKSTDPVAKINAAKFLQSKEVQQLQTQADELQTQVKSPDMPKALTPKAQANLEAIVKANSTPIPAPEAKAGALYGTIPPTQEDIDAQKTAEADRLSRLQDAQKQLDAEADRKSLVQQSLAVQQKLRDSKAQGPGGFLRRFQSGQSFVSADADEKKNDIAGTLAAGEQSQADRDAQRQSIQSKIAGGLTGPDLDSSNQQLSQLDQADQQAKPVLDSAKQNLAIANTPAPAPDPAANAPQLVHPMSAAQDFINNADRVLTKSLGPTLVAGAADLGNALDQSALNPAHWINKAVVALGGPDVEARQNADLAKIHEFQKTGEGNIDQAFPVDESRNKTWSRWASDLTGNTLPMLAGPGRLKTAIDGYMAVTGGEQAKEQLDSEGATKGSSSVAGVATGGIYALANHFLGPYTTALLKYIPGAGETLAKKAINAIVGVGANSARQGLELGAINASSAAVADAALAESGVKDTKDGKSPYQNPFKEGLDGLAMGAVLGGILTVPERAQVEMNSSRVGDALKTAGAKATFVQNTADSFLQIDQAKSDGKMTSDQAQQAKYDTLHFLTPENQAQVAAHVDNVNTARVQGAQILKSSAIATNALGTPDPAYRHLTDDQVQAATVATPDDQGLVQEESRRARVAQIQQVTQQRLGEVADNLKAATAATETLAQTKGGAATLASLVEHNANLQVGQKVDARAFLPVDQVQALTDPTLNNPEKAADALTSQGQPTAPQDIAKAQQLAGHSSNMPEHQEITEQQHSVRAQIEAYQKSGNKAGEIQARQAVVRLEGKRKQAVLQRLGQNVRASREIDSLRQQSDAAQAHAEARKTQPKEVSEPTQQAFADAKQKANRASGLAKISNGVHLSKLTAGELAAVGAVPDNAGGFKPTVGVSDVAKDPTKELSPVHPSKAGTPIITDEGARNLAKYAPQTAKLIYDGETDARTKADARADVAAEQESKEQGKKTTGKDTGKESAGGSWSARGDQGTEVSIPATDAKSQREAEPLLASKLPKGELLDVGSVEAPPKKVEKTSDETKVAPYNQANGQPSPTSEPTAETAAGKTGSSSGPNADADADVAGRTHPEAGASAGEPAERTGEPGESTQGNPAEKEAAGGAGATESGSRSEPASTVETKPNGAKSLRTGAIDEGVSRVKTRLAALNRSRGLTGDRAIGIEFTRDTKSGAISTHFAPDGKITIKINRGATEEEANSNRFETDEGDANTWLNDALNEEIIHVADMLTARDQWEAQGKPGTANEFWEDERKKDLATVKAAIAGGNKVVARAFIDSFRSYSNAGRSHEPETFKGIDDESVEDVALKLIGHLEKNGMDVPQMSEFIRQMIQAKQDGNLTETGYRAIVGRLLDWMKRVYDNIQQAAFESPELAKIIKPIEDLLEMADGKNLPPASDFKPMSDEEIAAQDKARKDAIKSAFGERQTLLQAVKKIGGIPTTDTTLQGELNNIKEAKNKGTMMMLFRKDAKPLDQVREALAEQGFHFETPAEMLTAINDSVNSGKPFYGLKAGTRAQSEFLDLGLYRNPGELPLKEKPAEDKKNSTQINMPPDLAKPFLDYANSIPESDLYKGEEGTDSYGPDYGREDKPHVTVHYGLESDPVAVQKLVKDFGAIKLKLGKTSLFKNEKYDVLKVGIEGDDIRRLNGALSKEYPVESDFPDYKPHLTIAYLKKGDGDKYAGDNRFEGKEVPIDQFVFSDKQRNHTPIDLTADSGKKPGDLVTAHRDIAANIASKYRMPGVEPADVRQEANVALIKAARAYDPNNGAKFSTFASRVISNRLNDVYGKQMNIAKNEEGGLDVPSEEDGLTREETTADDKISQTLPMEHAETQTIIDDEVRRLPKKPQAIVEGFRRGKSGQEIADELGISRQAVSDSLKGALTILRSRIKARGLEGHKDGILYAGERDKDFPPADEMPGEHLLKPEDLKIAKISPEDALEEFEDDNAMSWPLEQYNELDDYKQALDSFKRDDPETWDDFLPKSLIGEHAEIEDQASDMEDLAERLKDQTGIDPATADQALKLVDDIRKHGEAIGDRAQRNADYAKQVLDEAKAIAYRFMKVKDDQGQLFAGNSDKERDDYVNELMRQIRGDMPSQAEIDSLRQKAIDETPGQQTIGVPEKANYAPDRETRRGVDAIQDLAQSRREVETQQGWVDEARARVQRDPEAVKVDLLKKAFDPDVYGTFSPVDVKSAQLLVPRLMREAYASGDKDKIKEATALAWAYDAGGTEQARAFAARRDPFKTPAERHIEFLTKLVSTPDPKTRAAIKSEPDPAKRKDLLEKAQNERLEKITKALGEMGVKLEDVFAGETRVSLKTSTLAQNAVAGMGDAKRQKAARMIMDGFSDRQIAKALGVSPNDAAAQRVKFDQLLDARLADFADQGFTAKDLEIFDPSSLAAGVRKVKLTPEQKAQIVAEMRRKFRPDADVANSGKLQKRLKRRVDKPLPQNGKLSDNPIPEYEPMKQDEMKPGLTPEEQAEFNRTRKPNSDPTDSARYRQQSLDYEKEQPYEHVPYDPNSIEQTFRLARAVQAAGGTNALDMIYETWVNSILSGPQTHAALSVGMGANAAWDFSVQRGLEAALNATIFHDPNAAQFGEFSHIVKGVLPAITRGLRFAAKAFNSEEHYAFERSVLNQQMEFKDYDKTGGINAAIPGKIGRVIRIPARVVMFQDSFFKQVIGQLEASAQGYRLGKAQGLTGPDLEKFIASQVNMPGSEAWQRAVTMAEAGTFQTPLRDWKKGGGPAEGFAKKIQDMRHGGASSWQGQLGEKMLGFVFPFIRTPYNIFRTGLSKTPLGSVAVTGRIADGLFSLKDGKPFIDGYPKAQMVKDLATQTIAWTTAALMYGAVEGDKDDDKKSILITGSRPHGVDKEGSRDLANRVAGGPYQIRIGGRNGVYINYGRIEPFATVLGTLADAVRISKQHQDLATSIGKFGGYFMAQAQDKTFLQGISSLAEAAQTITQDPANMAKGLGRQFLQGLVPNLIRQPLRNLDEYERDTRNASPAYAATSLGGLAPKKYDLYGNAEIKQGNPLSRIVARSGDVPYSTLQRGDAFLQNWNRLNPDQPYYPARESNYSYKDLTGKKVAMTPDQIAQFDQHAGKAFASGMAGWLTPQMANAPKEDDVKMFREELEKARKETKDEMFGQGMARKPAHVGTDISSLMGWK